MAPNEREKRNRMVVLSIADGLRGAAEDKLAKELELNATEKHDDILLRLTRMEMRPGLRTDCFRLIAMGKSIIKGDLTRVDAFNAHVAWMNGMGPMPKDTPS